MKSIKFNKQLKNLERLTTKNFYKNILLNVFYYFFTKDATKVIAGINQVEGMDFDWTTDNLYWVDSGKKVIEVCRKDGRFRKTIHRDSLDKPRALALDPQNG